MSDAKQPSRRPEFRVLRVMLTSGTGDFQQQGLAIIDPDGRQWNCSRKRDKTTRCRLELLAAKYTRAYRLGRIHEREGRP